MVSRLLVPATRKLYVANHPLSVPRPLSRVFQAMYRDEDGATKPMEDLNRVCADRPVHLILGSVHDFMYVPNQCWRVIRGVEDPLP